MQHFGRICVFVAIGWIAARATAAEPISAKENDAAPTAARLAAIHSTAQREGWSGQKSALREAALRAYQRGNLEAARAWFHVYKWSALFAQTEDEFTRNWIQAVQNANVAHRGMSTQYKARAVTLSAYLSPESQAWLLNHPAYSEQFFGVIQPVDHLPAVFRALSELHGRDLQRFETFATLALAIAVVHDVPPPPDWPHPQVDSTVLPRQWPSAVQSFNWWTSQSQAGQTFHNLAELDADELKFVIDSAAPFDELEWSKQVANYPIDQLDRAYKMVGYRQDRATNSRPIWTKKDYSLPTILGSGGICVDQAFFAAHVGKARGVPTLIFQGPGSNGRHAWFGYLDGKQRWRLDAGRYAEQRFVTGIARDPQTWGAVSDHQLKFLGERFRLKRSYRDSQVHTAFATELLMTGDGSAAAAAARQAIKAEPRNPAAWQLLLAAGAATRREAQQQEATLAEAVRAFERYPDLETYYSNRLSRSLRDRGATNAADAEEQRIARKYQGDRSDLSVRQASEILLRTIATQPLAEQIRTYDATLNNYGRGAGIAFYDHIVRTFVEHLIQLGEHREARKAAESARSTLKVELNSQLEQEFEALLKRVRARG